MHSLAIMVLCIMGVIFLVMGSVILMLKIARDKTPLRKLTPEEEASFEINPPSYKE